jgi:hypothetical protein
LSSEDINKIIKKQQNMQKTGMNMNEYKIIKTNTENEETEGLTSNNAVQEKEEQKEIDEIHKEVINVVVEDEDKKENKDIEANHDNIEDLKSEVLNMKDQ